MGNKYISFNKFLFADNEKPTSFKLNQMLALLEETRLANGPYSITKLSQMTDTSFRIRMNEDPKKIGGLCTAYPSPRTIRRFKVFYETRETLGTDYACWDDVIFIYNNGEMFTIIVSGDNIYQNGVDVSDIDTAGLYCIRSSGHEQGW